MHWMFLKLVARCYTMLWRRRKTRTGAFFLQNTIIPHRTSIGTQVHQVWHHVFTDIQIDNPIHQVEANERNREEDSGIFVDVGRRNASHLLQVLLAVQHGRDLVQHQLIGVVSSVPSALSLLLSPRQESRSTSSATSHHIGRPPAQQGVMHINTYFLQSRTTEIRQTQTVFVWSCSLLSASVNFVTVL